MPYFGRLFYEAINSDSIDARHTQEEKDLLQEYLDSEGSFKQILSILLVPGSTFRHTTRTDIVKKLFPELDLPPIGVSDIKRKILAYPLEGMKAIAYLMGLGIYLGSNYF